MKVLSVVGDTPGWTYISEIFHEMLPASTRETIRHPELAAEKNGSSTGTDPTGKILPSGFRSLLLFPMPRSGFWMGFQSKAQ